MKRKKSPVNLLRLPSADPTVDLRFLLDPFEPAYLALHRTGDIKNRVAAGLRELEDCCACPRNCHVNRMANLAKVCNTGRYARVASAFPHFGEEDCLRGWNGSGTIFFSLMGQYRPEYEVGKIAGNGQSRYDSINRRPRRIELQDAFAAAREAGLWRFAERACS